MKSQILFLNIIASLFLYGCSSMANIPRYSTLSNELNKEMNGSTDKKYRFVKVESYRPNLKKEDCWRGNSPTLPDDMTFEKYLMDAVNSDLKLLKMYSDRPENKIDISVTEINSNSNFMFGKWIISAQISVDGHENFLVFQQTDVETSFGGYAACIDLADSFPQAVRKFSIKLLNKLNSL